MAVPAFQPKQQIIYFQGAKIMQTSTMKAAFKLPSAAYLIQRYRSCVSNDVTGFNYFSKIFVSPCTNSPRSSLRKDD